MKNSMLSTETINWIKQLDIKMASELLGRLLADCKYYYGYGNKCNKFLWTLHPWSQAEALEVCRDWLWDILTGSQINTINDYITKLYEEEE